MVAPLTEFFQGRLSIDDLRLAVKSRVHRGGTSKRISQLEHAQNAFRISAANLVVLCDLGIAGKLTEDELSDIAFWMLAADEIEWEEGDEVVTETLHDWSCPEVNFPLTVATLTRFRERLLKRDLSIAIN